MVGFPFFVRPLSFKEWRGLRFNPAVHWVPAWVHTAFFPLPSIAALMSCGATRELLFLLNDNNGKNYVVMCSESHAVPPLIRFASGFWSKLLCKWFIVGHFKAKAIRHRSFLFQDDLFRKQKEVHKLIITWTSTRLRNKQNHRLCVGPLLTSVWRHLVKLLMLYKQSFQNLGGRSPRQI